MSPFYSFPNHQKARWWTRFLFCLGLVLLFVGIRFAAGWPEGVDRDENQDCWNARCLAELGTDFQGNRAPLILVDYGDDKHALYSWLLAGFESLGVKMRPERARVFSSFLVGLGALLFALAFAIHSRRSEDIQTSKAKKNGDFGRLVFFFAIFAFLPWLQVGPCLAWECSTNLPGYGAMFLGMVLMQRGSSVVLSSACFLGGWAFAVYGYPAAKVLAPILLAGGAWFGLRSRKQRWLFFGAGCLLMLPLLVDHALHPEHTDRGRFFSIFTLDAGTALTVFFRTYIAHFSPDFLFFRGDLYPRHFAGFLGVLPIALGFGLLYRLLQGLSTGLKTRRFRPTNRTEAFLLLCLVIFPLPAALTKDGLPHPDELSLGTGHVLRTLLGAFALCWFGVQGLFAISKRRRWFGRTLLGLCLLQSAAALVHLHISWRDAESTKKVFHETLYARLRELAQNLEVDRVFVSPLPKPMESPFPLIHFLWTAFDSMPVKGRFDPLIQKFSFGCPHVATRGKPQVLVFDPAKPFPKEKNSRDLFLYRKGSSLPPGFKKQGPLEGEIWMAFRNVR
jgi:hypothetical protein